MNDEYEVIIVRYGTRETVRSEVFLNYALYGTADASIAMDYFIWIARNDERTVLIDTGFSENGGSRRGRSTVVHPHEAWAALGIAPDSAPVIVITHAHYDHTGNLDHFPDSRIVMAEKELEFWRTQTSRHVLFDHSAEAADLETIDRAVEQGRVDLFRESTEVAPGIHAIEVGGHTPGQAVVTVNTAEGTVLLASDAIHYYEEYTEQMPFMSVANLVDMYRGFDLIAGWVADGVVSHVVAGHDPDTLSRFRPLHGPLSGNAAIIGGSR